jgi:hypothetical protein
MFTTHTRHFLVAFGLGAVALVTGASAAGLVNHGRPAAHTQVSAPAPFVSGDLGEVIVTAPGDLGEVIVRAPADLGEVLVKATRINPPERLLADVTVTAPRFVRESVTAGGGATMVVAQ